MSVKDHVDTLAEYKDYLWNNKDIDPHEIRSMRESILNHFAIGESVIDKRRRLAKIVDIPYFGRIDFQDVKLSACKNAVSGESSMRMIKMYFFMAYVHWYYSLAPVAFANGTGKAE